MKQFSKILVGSLIGCFLFLIGLSSTSAASGSVSVRLSKSSVVVGTTITATVTVSSTDPLGSWQASLVYDSSKLQFLSSTADGQTMIGVGDGSVRNKTYTFTFKAIASGTANVSISSATILDWNTDGAIGVTRGSANVSILTQQQIEESYSKNNYLSSLTIEGKELNFNKDTLEYNVEFDPETPKMVVGATAEDKTASISGTGEIALSEGANRVEIKVTAQNGNVRTYVINATVKEYNPILVKVGDQDYTVVRKKADLQPPNQFIETTVTINNEEVPAFYNEITKITIVGLKDASGKVGYYRYENDTYAPYQELSFNRVLLLAEVPDATSIPKGFVARKMKFGDQEVPVYFHEKLEKTLLYGMNVETGKSHFYVYEEQENTLQIFNEQELTALSSDFDLKLILILGSTTALFFGSTIVFLVLFSRAKRGPKGKKEPKPLQESSLDEEEVKEEKSKKKEKHRKKKSILFDEEE